VPSFRRRQRPVDRPRRFTMRGPFPTYRTRTRRGTDVSISGCGCCLPIPLLALLGTAGGLRALWRWAHR
jgi:hypothetical protein